MSRPVHLRSRPRRGRQIHESQARAIPRPRRLPIAAICAGLAIITFAALQGVLSNGFVNYDDDVYVTQNAQVQQGLRGESIRWAFTTTDGANWHPLTWLSHILDVHLYGLDAGKHHRTSLLLHTSNALLLFLLLVRMTGALWRCAFAACLFAIHPLHVESVAWIAERKDVLSTLFWLLTLAAWLRYLESRTVSRTIPVIVLYAFGLMAKPMLVTLPFTLLLLDVWPLRRLTLPLRGQSGTFATLLMEKAPLFAMSAASCIMTVIAQRSGGAVQNLEDFGFSERLANSALAYASYLIKTFWPMSLAVLYPHTHAGLLSWPVAGSILLLAAVTALALRLATRGTLFFAFGWFWYLGTLVPVIGLVQVGGAAMADRYTYVPLIGVFIAIAWGLAEFAKGTALTRRAVAAAAVTSLVALAAATRIQVGYWAGTAALFEHTLAVTSDNWLAHNNLGRALSDGGKTEEAIAHYTEALRIRPDYAGAHLNLGNALAGAGKTDEAIGHYDEAVRLRPDFAEAHNNLGTALVRQGRNAEAIEQYNQALRLKTDSSKVHNNLGVVLVGVGRIEEAIEHYEQALRLRPDYFEALDNLGLALARMNRSSEAIERFRQALRIDPESAEAHNNLGAALARSERIPEALEHFERALRIDPNFSEARANLRGAQEALQRRR